MITPKVSIIEELIKAAKGAKEVLLRTRPDLGGSEHEVKERLFESDLHQKFMVHIFGTLEIREESEDAVQKFIDRHSIALNLEN